MPGMPSRTTVSRWARERGVSRPKGRRRGKGAGMKRPEGLPEVVGDEPAYAGFEGDKDEQIRKLQLENDILRGMVEVLKGVSLDQASNREKSLLIEWLRRETDHPLT